MTIEVEEDEEGATVYIGEEPVMSARCLSWCERVAKTLVRARDSSHRSGMRILTEELGMCEGAATTALLLMSNTGRKH